jgi:hypothetical protein
MDGMHDNFGVMASPAMYGVPKGIKEGRFWALDNGAFTGAFEATRWLSFMDELRPWAGSCLFVIVPDVWGDVEQTLIQYEYWAGPLAADWPIALAAQPGLEQEPWPEGFDWLFVGGTDDWRQGPGAKTCIARAKVQGALVHIGRVNSIKRFEYFQRLGADSADGTTAAFGPDIAARLLTRAVMQRSFVEKLFK